MKVRFFSKSFLVLGILMLVNVCWASGQYAFEVSITPDQKTPDIYISKLTVTDLITGKTITNSTVRFRATEQAVASVKDTDGKTFRYTVNVDPATSTAEYKIAVFEGDSAISRSEAKISLIKNQ